MPLCIHFHTSCPSPEIHVLHHSWAVERVLMQDSLTDPAHQRRDEWLCDTFWPLQCGNNVVCIGVTSVVTSQRQAGSLFRRHARQVHGKVCFPARRGERVQEQGCGRGLLSTVQNRKVLKIRDLDLLVADGVMMWSPTKSSRGRRNSCSSTATCKFHVCGQIRVSYLSAKH